MPYNYLMNYPKVRFRDSFLLIGAIYQDIEAAYMPPATDEDERYKLHRDVIQEKLTAYEKAWKPYESRVIEGICEILGLEFQQNVLDIYAAPFYTSFSFPIVIATKYHPDRAVEVITHELIHVLLYDNTSSEIDMNREASKWRRLFPDVTDEVTLIHIPVHAALQAVFDDILQEPERTIRDKEMTLDYKPYKEAWEYVGKNGYKNIIQQLRAE